MNEFTTEQNQKIFTTHDSKDLVRLLLIIFIDYLYRIFIITPISFIKNYSRHPVSITCVFLFLFPIYLILQFFVSVIKFVTRLAALKHQDRLMHLKNYIFGDVSNKNNNVQQQWNTRDHFINRGRQHDDDDEDDIQQWLERCSICFESKLDLCLDYCRDQFCLECFQKYVSEVVKSSWGLSVTKIRCPVCRVYVPQTEWTKFVPNSIVELYNKFNRPYRSFSRCCPHCETEVTPCDFLNKNSTATTNRSSDSRSKNIASMIKTFFSVANSHVTVEQRLDHLLPNLTYQQYLLRLFEKSEWRNATLPDIHIQLVTRLIKGCAIVDQTALVKNISREILQLEMRPDTWRRLQFDHISFFSNTDCPSCEKTFCIQCGHYDSHKGLTCEENMKCLIFRNKDTKLNDEFLQTLKWKLENSRNCPNCSIMINRDEGCNKVDCTLCGFSFCWECKSTWSEVGCGYFNCSLVKNLKNKVEDEQRDEGFASSSNYANSNNQTTELGVPNVNAIHSRLNNMDNDT